MVRPMRILKRLSFVLAAATVVVPTVALAQMVMHPVTGIGKPSNTNTTVAPSATPSTSASAAPTTTTGTDAGSTTAGSADASTATTTDAGASDESADQHARRKAYVDKTYAKIRELTRANGKHVTEEERAAIRKHWRHTMRLWRIRNLAENDKDTGIVARVDALLATADKHLFDKLKTLNAAAPATTGGK